MIHNSSVKNSSQTFHQSYPRNSIPDIIFSRLPYFQFKNVPVSKMDCSSTDNSTDSQSNDFVKDFLWLFDLIRWLSLPFLRRCLLLSEIVCVCTVFINQLRAKSRVAKNTDGISREQIETKDFLTSLTASTHQHNHQHINTSTRQHSTSTQSSPPQHINNSSTSTLTRTQCHEHISTQLVSTSTHAKQSRHQQHISTSTRQHLNTSTHQHHNTYTSTHQHMNT